MPDFSPYHKLASASRLEKLVTHLSTKSAVSAAAFDGHQMYHPALLHKLLCAKHHLARLQDKLGANVLQELANDADGLMFAVNMSIDGFFYACGSALDILAREVLICFGELLPSEVYFQTAHNIISKRRPNDPILDRLKDPPWLRVFKTYRNTLTHELILASHLHVDYCLSGSELTKAVIPLPDDPRKRPADRTFKQHPDVLAYMEEHMKRLLRLTNTVYGDICTRAETKGCIPL
jgi:hypothetical protein